ncbi:hypothetical protein LuPra_02749 [Luteitalea pratensis]|uniref:Transposase DDE domain-containing protein n=2 Tax=Luteitalea pratensis TaxID=1855912 RepID=A0A143PMZ3_LUTPR|nr:hypothetical protein LuPra_02749 [Luteitalea pratensis]
MRVSEAACVLDAACYSYSVSARDAGHDCRPCCPALVHGWGASYTARGIDERRLFEPCTRLGGVGDSEAGRHDVVIGRESLDLFAANAKRAVGAWLPTSRQCVGGWSLWHVGGPRRHDRAMKSRVHPTYKTRYRVGNWRLYERALVSRGDVTLWLSPDARAAWIVPPSGRPGGQQRFSNLAIETALTLRLVFRLPLRQTEGFVRSILTVMRTSLDAPDHTTLSRRGQVLKVAVHHILATEPLHLIVDSSGLSVVGEGSGWRRNTADVAREAGRSCI